MGISTYSMGRFEEFAPDNPNVKPSSLVVPTGVNATSPHPTGWWHSAGRATHTNWTPMRNDVASWWNDNRQIFLNNGHPYTVLPMDNPGYRASVTWNSVGTYDGKPVGCTLSLSNPVIGNGYDNNKGAEPENCPILPTALRDQELLRRERRLRGVGQLPLASRPKVDKDGVPVLLLRQTR